jgi:hemoglobin
MGKSLGKWALAFAAISLSACQTNATPPLYVRLGGDVMISAIVEDFVGEAASDPRVNFTRKGTPGEWLATPDNVDILKAHLTAYFESATGGSSDDSSRDLKTVHQNMQITDAEFDALKEDLARSLAKYDEPPRETSEMLALVEASRKEIVQVK